MNIAIIGYGRMGRTIEKIAKSRKHNITAVIDVDNQDEIHQLKDKNIDVAIEFTQPASAFDNITSLLKQNIAVVSGTTGWLEKMDEVKALTETSGTGFLYAPNFSVGVNLFFAINEYAARIMNNVAEFDVKIEEVHHLQKLDSPSGTAIQLAEDVIRHLDRKTTWENNESNEGEVLEILSAREPDVPGIHKTVYSGDFDRILLEHTATSRDGFATGAVLAAEFLKGKKGIFSMKDVLDL